MMLNDPGQALLDPAPRRRPKPSRVAVCAHPRRAPRRSAAVPPAAAPCRARMSEAAEALDIALDRMIDEIVRQDRAERR